MASSSLHMRDSIAIKSTAQGFAFASYDNNSESEVVPDVVIGDTAKLTRVDN